MNIKDFTLKLGYTYEGKAYAESLDCGEVDGFENENLSLKMKGDLKISITPKRDVKLSVVEIVWDRFFERDDIFFANGFQSWTLSREYKKGDNQVGLYPLAKLPVFKKFAGASGDYHFTEYGRDLFHSFTYTYIRRGDKVELMGSLNERTGYTVFYADMKENVFVASKDVDGLALKGEYELFDLFWCTGSYDEAFDKYFAAYPKKHTGRVKHLAGYTSWYNYYQKIDEDIILRDLEGLKRAKGYANIFQIDDGYETKIGDWEIDKTKFKNGLRPIVDKIHEQGLLAGLWFAPFAAQFKAEIIKKHPEWLVKDAKGKPLVSGIAWGGFYALDFELEEVKNFIRNIFRQIFEEWGFDMVKLDFLYAAAILPRNGKTRGQLMCEAMDFLRECCGDKLLLGCGVPLGPSFGVVDACRIGCDAEISFKDRFYAKLTNQEIISTKNAMCDTIFRRHLNGRIMANDPDVFFLRDDGLKIAKYNEIQKRLLAKLNHIFGSVLFVSDNVGNYDDEKLKILLESYKPFEGKVISAEFKDSENIRVVYDDGEEKTLVFNIFTGAYGEI